MREVARGGELDTGKRARVSDLVLEYLQGKTLAAKIAKGPLPAAGVNKIMAWPGRG